MLQLRGGAAGKKRPKESPQSNPDRKTAMPSLLLLRHAKSDWSNPGLGDFDRPLNKRGRRAAPLIGRYLREADLIPDLVLCSAARRAQETWELVAAELKQDVPVKTLRSLYLAAPSRLMASLLRVPDAPQRVLLIGHNPGMEHLAALLTGGGDPAARSLMLEKFPTAALALLRLDGAAWDTLAPGGAVLERFVRPRDLE